MITKEVMTDPVQCPEGNTFERAALEEWLEKTGTSPITRTALSIDECVTNRGVRQMCEDWSRTHNNRRKRRRTTPTSGGKRQRSLWNPDEAQNDEDDSADFMG